MYSQAFSLQVRKSQYEKEYHNLNETARFKKCKQLLEYQHFFLLRDICWSKLLFFFNAIVNEASMAA
jgi:hypothetical protein